MVEAVLGPILEVDARSEIRWPIVKLTETGDKSSRETPDRIEILGNTRSGAAFTAEIEGGVQPENIRFSFEIRGSDGWLSLTSSHPYGFQAGDLKWLFTDSSARLDGGIGQDRLRYGRDWRWPSAA